MFDDIENDQDGGKGRNGRDGWKIGRNRGKSQTDSWGNHSRCREGVKHVPARERERREIYGGACKEDGRHAGAQGAAGARTVVPIVEAIPR